MKPFLALSPCLLVALSLLSFSTAAADKPDPAGTWKLHYAIGDQQKTATLTITRDGDTLAGTMSWPDQKDQKLKDVKLTDNDLTFSAERKVADNTYTVEYKLTISGDVLKGTGAVVVGSEKRPFDVDGKREKNGK